MSTGTQSICFNTSTDRVCLVVRPLPSPTAQSQAPTQSDDAIVTTLGVAGDRFFARHSNDPGFVGG